MLPTLVAHADWGTGPCNRWIAYATHLGDGVYRARAPEEVGALAGFVMRLCEKAGPEACVALGFDFPIGLRRFYAHQAGIADFKFALTELFGKHGWSHFFDVAKTAHEISLLRPFYPLKSGKKGEHRKRHLLDALHAPSTDALLRSVIASTTVVLPRAACSRRSEQTK